MYHLSPDEGIAVRDIVRIIAERMNVRFEDVTRMVDERPGQDAAYVIDSTRARQELEWSPKISLQDGLSDVVDWVETYWDGINAEPLTYQHKA
jgi:dTDP-glucose 4,6-dehydratase